jgi:hypothetical protein
MADEKVVIFKNENLPVAGFAQMEEIRRHGKLCDVTLKVNTNKQKLGSSFISNNQNKFYWFANWQ